MKILVTGGAGFIGSNLVERLVARGDELTVLDNFDVAYDTQQLDRNLAAVRDRIRLVRADLCDASAVADAARGAEVVVHLAAQTGVRRSLEQPARYARSNVEGTIVLLEQMRSLGLDRLVFASSSSVYGARTGGPFVETDSLGQAQSPYAASKQAGEGVVRLWNHLYRLRATVLRFFTVYGPRQRPEMAIHRFARMLLRGESLPVYGDGASSRDYTYVGDIVEGVVAAIDKPTDFATVNLGNRSPVRLNALVAAIGEAVDRVPVIERLPNQPGDVPMTWADTSRAEALLGYAPHTPLAEGLASFVQWLAAEIEAGR
jgi:UDP-glucuronate 4-epimerase